MYTWILDHRDDVILILGVSMVAFPLILGAVLGHVPKEFLIRAGLPFIALTFSMAMGVFFLKKVLQPVPMLSVSIVFGLTWVVIGLQAILRRDGNWMGKGGATPSAIRGLGWIFVLFGLLWISIALGNFSNWNI